MRKNKNGDGVSRRFLRVTALLAAAVCLLAGCQFRPSDGEDTTAPQGTKPIQTTPIDTNPPVTDSTVTDPTVSGSDSASDSTTDTKPPEPVYDYFNPLTGVGSLKDLTHSRPLAVVIANYYQGAKNQTEAQVNLSAADILYEYPVEGNYTRLLALFSDYESLGEVGALRSARYYDVQLALGHDAIFASCGGSDLYKIDTSLLKYGAYYYFTKKLVDYLDFTNDKDLTALKLTRRDFLTNLGASSTNSVTVSGADFKAAIEKKGYSTTLSSAYDYGMNFSTSTVSYGSPAKHVKLNVTSSRRVDFIYNATDGLYYRYQFSDDEGLLKHYDASNDQQLSFANVVLLYTEVSAIKEDSKSSGNDSALDRKYVNLIGTGTGYFVTAGTCTAITWKKANENAPLKYYDASGNEIVFNPGKTCVEICSTTFKAGTTME